MNEPNEPDYIIDGDDEGLDFEAISKLTPDELERLTAEDKLPRKRRAVDPAPDAN